MITNPLDISCREVPYRDRDTSLTGVLCQDQSPADRPGLLLFHGGAGLDEHARQQARRYAALGYSVLACDMFGEGIAGDRDRVIGCLMALRDDPALLVRRARAGLGALKTCPGTRAPVAAVGFCFGGLTALQLARSGMALAAVVSMHGSLATRAPATPGAIRGRVLACHGAADPHVPMSDVAGFAEEMEQAGADWQLIMYGGAQHGFTHADAQPGATPGVAYDEAADQRSFAAARDLLAEALGSGG